MRISARARALIATAVFGAWTVLTYACSVGVENPALTSNDINAEGTDGSQPVGAAICAKYGGFTNVRLLAGTILTTASFDCRIQALVKDPNDTHVTDCFASLIGASFQCPGVSFTENVTTDSEGKACESILPGMSLSAEDWEAFAGYDADASVLSASASVLRQYALSSGDIRAVLAFFATKEATVLNSEIPEGKYTKCVGTCDRGGDACKGVPEAGPVDSGGGGTGPKDSGGGGGPKDTGVADAPTDG